jgi:hypothetical protein
MGIVAKSATRAQAQTDPAVNQRTSDQMRANVAYYAAHPEQIDQRLRELDAEWDIERWLELNSAALTLAGLTLAVVHSRKWLLLPLVVQGFFLQHGIEGYCPPLPIFRRAGVRTEGEIEAERQALKALRGDFNNAEESEQVLLAAER